MRRGLDLIQFLLVGVDFNCDKFLQRRFGSFCLKTTRISMQRVPRSGTSRTDIGSSKIGIAKDYAFFRFSEIIRPCQVQHSEFRHMTRCFIFLLLIFVVENQQGWCELNLRVVNTLFCFLFYGFRVQSKFIL